MPVGAEPRAVTLLLETLRLLRDELGVNTTCGASNTSFGAAGPARARRRLPRPRPEPRPDERDHGRALAASRRGRPGDRLPARPRRMGRPLDRPVPRQAGGGDASVERSASTDPRRWSPSAEPAASGSRFVQADEDRRQGGPRPGRDDPLRRGELERRSRSTRPAAATAPARSARCGSSRLGAASAGRPARLRARRAARRLAPRLPRAGARGPPGRRCRRCRRGRRRRSPASAAT